MKRLVMETDRISNPSDNHAVVFHGLFGDGDRFVNYVLPDDFNLRTGRKPVPWEVVRVQCEIPVRLEHGHVEDYSTFIAYEHSVNLAADLAKELERGW